MHKVNQSLPIAAACAPPQPGRHDAAHRLYCREGGGTGHIATEIEAEIADLANAPDDGVYELVEGKLMRMPPTGFMPNLVAGEIFVALRAYARQSGGYAMTDGVAYIVALPHRPHLAQMPLSRDRRRRIRCASLKA